jgi:hypothetical protein
VVWVNPLARAGPGMTGAGPADARSCSFGKGWAVGDACKKGGGWRERIWV